MAEESNAQPDAAEAKVEGEPAANAAESGTQETKENAEAGAAENVPSDSQGPEGAEAKEKEAVEGGEQKEGAEGEAKGAGEGEAKGSGEGEGGEGKAPDKENKDESGKQISSAMVSQSKMRKKPEYITESLMKFYKYMGLEPEEGEETRDLIEEIVKIDRKPYYVKHAILSKEIAEEKIKNGVIQKKLAQYFKKKKMDHVLKESGDQVESQQKYNKKLDAYGELTEMDTRERNATTSEITDLKEKKESKFQELIILFHDMQQREKDIGTGLINTKTGKIIPDKLVERLIRLQRSQMEVINSMRLKYIRLKNLVIEKQNKTAILDKIGEDLYLRDYEQLKIENRGLEDKIEERDDELSKLRSKYETNIQMLAHVREKSSALQTDIDNIKEEISVIDAQCTKVREQLNNCKQQRDYYRYMTNKINNESGLLNETELLRDMEDSMEELNVLTIELEDLKKENKIKAQQIRNIRKNIEISSEILAKKSIHKSVSGKQITSSQMYKKRPTLHKPTLPSSAADDIKNYKFHPSVNRRKKSF